MTTRDHLIYRLQDQYAFHRDLLPLLDAMHHEAGAEQLRTVLTQQRERIRTDLETLERALDLLGGRYKMEHNVLDPGVHEATQRFKRQMNPAREQLDIYVLLLLISLGELSQGAYWGDIELARALGEQDVVKLLEENNARQTETLHVMHALAPVLIQGVSRGEARQAA